MDVSACKFFHSWTCLYTICHIISFVCARPTCIYAVCRLRDEFMRVLTHKNMGLATLFDLRNHVSALL